MNMSTDNATQMGSGGETGPGSIDLLSDAAFQCPYPVYDRLRTEAPVHYDEKRGGYFITKMADIRHVLNNPAVFSNEILDLVGMSPSLRRVTMPAPGLLFVDPPLHARSRSLVDRAFTAPRVNRMAGLIQSILDGLFKEFIGLGRVDVFSQLAMPLPVDLIGRELGVPLEGRDQFRRWGFALANAFNPALTTGQRDDLVPMVEEVNAYMLAKRREKRAKPTEDILSVLSSACPKESITKEGDEKGSELSDGEFLTIVQQLVIAGTENTTAGILSAIYELVRSPEMFARLRADPALVGPFVEEILRLESPGSGFIRLVKQDTELGGVKIPKGSIVQLRYGAANRDPAQFECPAQLDMGRRNASNHLAFGSGPHACIGQMLARKELVFTVRTVCTSMTSLSMDPDHAKPRYTHTFFLRCLDSLHLRFTVAAA